MGGHVNFAIVYYMSLMLLFFTALISSLAANEIPLSQITKQENIKRELVREYRLILDTEEKLQKGTDSDNGDSEETPLHKKFKEDSSISLLLLAEEPKKASLWQQCVRAFKQLNYTLVIMLIIFLFSMLANTPNQFYTTDYFGHNVYGGIADSQVKEEELKYEAGVRAGAIAIGLQNLVGSIYSG